jgi:hypothetical protein
MPYVEASASDANLAGRPLAVHVAHAAEPTSSDMSRKKPPQFVVGENGQRWNLDDFDLDSHGVQAPQREVFEMLAEMGRKPEDVNETVREKYAKYLERMRKKNEKEQQKAKK